MHIERIATSHLQTNQVKTYHKPSDLSGIVNGNAFWSNFSEEQYSNLEILAA